MSSTAEIKKLDVVPTIKEAIAIGSANIGPILVNVALWALTVWIPYLNVGTTIGLAVGIVSKASKGEIIPFTEIFDPKYRKYMGEFFLTAGLLAIGIGVGTAFFIIPGIIIAIAWSLALLLLIDRGKNPAEAISLSNNLTYGCKGRIFCVYFAVFIVFFVVQIILLGIADAADSDAFESFAGFIVFLTALFEIFVFTGVQASVYRQLADNGLVQ